MEFLLQIKQTERAEKHGAVRSLLLCFCLDAYNHITVAYIWWFWFLQSTRKYGYTGSANDMNSRAAATKHFRKFNGTAKFPTFELFA